MPAGKKLVSHFRVSRKSVTSAQTDRRVTTDGPSYIDVDLPYTYTCIF